LATGIFNPARQAIINDIVPQQQIKKANALFGSTFAPLHLVAPFVAAWIFPQTSRIHEIVAIDLFAHLVGIWFLTRWQSRPRPTIQEIQLKFFDELAEGFRYLKKRIDLMSMFIIDIIVGFIIGALIPLLLPYMQENLNAGEKEYGVIL